MEITGVLEGGISIRLSHVLTFLEITIRPQIGLLDISPPPHNQMFNLTNLGHSSGPMAIRPNAIQRLGL